MRYKRAVTTEVLSIEPCGHPVDATLRPPGSKSLAHRALVCAALARGPSRIEGLPDGDDVRRMIEALSALGFRVEPSGRVQGSCGEVPAPTATIDAGGAGTVLRLLTALCALGRGPYRLDGDARMRERPVGPLLSALRALGGHARDLAGNGCPPVEIRGGPLRGGAVRLESGMSSQFESALWLVSPFMERPLEVESVGQAVSRPYVAMTRRVMTDFGVVGPGGRASTEGYRGRRYAVEADASGATFLWAAAAVTGGRVRVPGIPTDSPQGELAVLGVLEAMGCRVVRGTEAIQVEGGTLQGVDVDCGDIPDAVPALAVVAAFARGTSRFLGVAHLRHKESDRLEALAAGLHALGAGVEVGEGEVLVRPDKLHGGTICSAGDHRIAMAFGVAGLAVSGVSVQDPGCVAKSYPGFFRDIARLRVAAVRTGDGATVHVPREFA
ncbi:MAG: 3-phosphoshikimate 1-carboxyvinyltransferase [Planctomycetes bacterium]|nr:3-phosphoshikimate 1-carboxyvinyltransferase [Planctomycetota bacterium]